MCEQQPPKRAFPLTYTGKYYLFDTIKTTSSILYNILIITNYLCGPFCEEVPIDPSVGGPLLTTLLSWKGLPSPALRWDINP